MSNLSMIVLEACCCGKEQVQLSVTDNILIFMGVAIVTAIILFRR